MDINSLYAQHQLGVMRAGHADSGSARSLHLASARKAAGAIVSYQLSQDAPAAAGWLRGMAVGEPPIVTSQRLAR